MTDPLMSRDEVAELWGIDRESVRSALRREGIHEVRGYPREQVLSVKRPGKGWRAGQKKARRTPDR